MKRFINTPLKTALQQVDDLYNFLGTALDNVDHVENAPACVNRDVICTCEDILMDLNDVYFNLKRVIDYVDQYAEKEVV